ncbi:nitrate regulatory protein [Billgrantia endophytica]|uniref:Response regulator receiver protein n=1 Tax=Billgrantia endophytica TaxID=2033802 RepID=A0A2N7TWF6_9GAMM|nr:nitrate regulatory protein [Halomonas endophytica]PMR72514.1 response regulator receiver protein [Halomonas endophytica]
MTPAEHLLLAAKRCEINALEHLATTCEIVGDISRFIHALQKERGASNVYLTSRGERFETRRRERIAECLDTERIMRQRLDILTSEGGRPVASARLLERIARVSNALDSLDGLRRDIECLRISADESTLTFNRLISGLLSVVFDAADTAGDPEITRALVAIFHFMQGKELAGQERACGAIGFTAGHFDDTHRQLLLHLVDAQQRCFDTFNEFATAQARQSWDEGLPPRTQAGIHQLRDMACRGLPRSTTGRSLGETWYELTTRRIDAMMAVEDTLADELFQMCRCKISTAREHLTNRERLQASLAAEDETPSMCQQLVELLDDQPSRTLGNLTATAVDSPLNRSLIELMQAQAARLQGLSDELEHTRKALRERKLVERAKGLIMDSQQMTEEQAYRFLRKMSMDQSKSMTELANSILDLSDILKKRAGQDM